MIGCGHDGRDDGDGMTPLRMLIAEDELILAYAMRGQLEQRGVEVVGLAADGTAAVAQCRQLHPDVILMDVRMPEIDGIEGTRLIMQHCPTCVIIVTAFADEETRTKAEAAGAMGFLSKPIQAAGVLEEVPQARARFAEFAALCAESSGVEEALAARRLVEAAKARLVAAGAAEAAAAFAALTERARQSGTSLRAMAERVVAGTNGDGPPPSL
jgi:AmiR/NasT family two-component response regulator